MAEFVFGMNVSLDGFVDHDRLESTPALFQHWTDQVGGLTASIYGRHVYELMQYWDVDNPDWTPAHHAFARAWRRHPKYVVATRLAELGPNATLVQGDIEATIRRLKTELHGEVAVSGPQLAYAVARWGLIDLYRLYLSPAVLGHGRPFFAGPLPPMQLVANEMVSAEVLRLTYRPLSADGPS